VAKPRDRRAEYQRFKSEAAKHGRTARQEKEYRRQQRLLRAEQPYTYDNRGQDGVPEWDSFGNHGEEGSRWHWELGQSQDHKGEKGTRFRSLSDANKVARDIKQDERAIIKSDTNSEVGEIGYVHVFEDEDGWGIEIDAYIEY
jgi:hypothetical protein